MTASGMTGGSDAVEFLMSQHREVEQLWSRLQGSHANGADDQRRLAEEIVKMLSQHDAIETQLLYPELRKSAGEEGQRLSDHSLDEHQVVRELLNEVDGQDIADEAVFSTMSRCISMVMSHVAEEEGQIFPLLRRHTDATRLAELGERMTELLQTAPTHPHPLTPDSKLGATVAGAVTGVVDRARDAARDAKTS